MAETLQKLCDDHTRRRLHLLASELGFQRSGGGNGLWMDTVRLAISLTSVARQPALPTRSHRGRRRRYRDRLARRGNDESRSCRSYGKGSRAEHARAGMQVMSACTVRGVRARVGAVYAAARAYELGRGAGRGIVLRARRTRDGRARRGRALRQSAGRAMLRAARRLHAAAPAPWPPSLEPSHDLPRLNLAVAPMRDDRLHPF